MIANCRSCLPATEVRETKDNYTIMIELPGSNRDDVKVWQDKNVLTVSGEKKAPSGNRVWNERVFGKFERSFSMPDDADKDRIEANYADGVVTVTIAKLEQAKPKNIKLN